MSPTELAKYTVAFGRQYEGLTPGTIGYRGALLAHRNFLAQVMDEGFDGTNDSAEIVAEMQGLLKQAVKAHTIAGGQAVTVPALDGLGCSSGDGMGAYERGGVLRWAHARRQHRARRRASRQENIAEGVESIQDVAEERQDRRVRSLRKGRTKFQRRALRRAQRQRARLVRRSRRKGLGARLARGLIRLGDRMKRRSLRRARRRARRRRGRGRRRR